MVQLILIFVLFSCTLFSYFLNRLLVKSVTNPGVSAKMQDSDARWAAKTKPTVGGLSFYITFILAALVLFVSNAGISDFSHEFLGLVIVSTLGFLLGLQDDAYSTRPLLKLSGQILCGVIMVFFGVQINLFHVPVIDAFLTVFWVVGIMNAVNLLDNMDGVTGSISLIIVATVVVLMATFGVQNSPMFYSLVAVGGAIFGFLFLNWSPSKLYMGDTGSQFLGAFLSFIGIRFLWNMDLAAVNEAPILKVLIPLMVFLVPIMDTTFVTFGRIFRKQSPFVGGRDHLSHYLNYVGVSEKFVPVVLGLVTIFSGILAVFATRYLSNGDYSLTLAIGSYIAITVSAFLLVYMKGHKIARVKEAWRNRHNRASMLKQEEYQTVQERQPA